VNALPAIERAASDAKLEFIVIGGFAVIKHGYDRFTKDLDIVVLWDAKDAWHKLLEGLGYVLISKQEVFHQYEPRESGAWPLDLMFTREATFRQMIAASKIVSLEGATARLVALEHLIALKLHALKQSRLSRFLKDFGDVVKLVQLNKLDLSSAPMRGLFLKYGNAELYEKILRACAAS
jgi:predicted nucleotidyltransferase